jgi:phage-related protein
MHQELQVENTNTKTGFFASIWNRISSFFSNLWKKVVVAKDAVFTYAKSLYGVYGVRSNETLGFIGRAKFIFGATSMIVGKVLSDVYNLAISVVKGVVPFVVTLPGRIVDIVAIPVVAPKAILVPAVAKA